MATFPAENATLPTLCYCGITMAVILAGLHNKKTNLIYPNSLTWIPSLVGRSDAIAIREYSYSYPCYLWVFMMALPLPYHSG